LFVIVVLVCFTSTLVLVSNKKSVTTFFPEPVDRLLLLLVWLFPWFWETMFVFWLILIVTELWFVVFVAGGWTTVGVVAGLTFTVPLLAGWTVTGTLFTGWTTTAVFDVFFSTDLFIFYAGFFGLLLGPPPKSISSKLFSKFVFFLFA